MKYYKHCFYAHRASSFQVVKPIEIVCDEIVIAYTDDTRWTDYLIKGDTCDFDEKEEQEKAKELLRQAMQLLKRFRENGNSPVVL